MGNNFFFPKNMRLIFKIDAIDGKKWVKFAMQQNSTSLIYDLNTVKGRVKSSRKKNAQPFKTVEFQAWTHSPCSMSIKKKRKLFWATLNGEEHFQSWKAASQILKIYLCTPDVKYLIFSRLQSWSCCCGYSFTSTALNITQSRVQVWRL